MYEIETSCVTLATLAKVESNEIKIFKLSFQVITIRMNGRKNLGMKLFSSDGDDATLVFVDEVRYSAFVARAFLQSLRNKLTPSTSFLYF